jgi:hypothetical protein
MIEVPKIVHDRLRTGPPAQTETAKAHPDADLLAALTEQALSGPEREAVLAHLALCEDCREVVALALPVADLASASNTVGKDMDPNRVSLLGTLAPRKASLFGPTMRWVALAAAVVVVASVMLIRPRKLNGPTAVAVNPQVAILPSVTSPAATPAASGSSTMSPADARSNDDQASQDQANKDRSRFASAMLQKHAAPADHATSETLLASNRKDSDRSGTSTSSMSLASTARSNAGAKGARATNEAVEVSGANVAAESQASSANNLLAFNDSPPIEKAKPALQEPSFQDQDATTVNRGNKEVGGAIPLANSQNSKALSAAKLSSATGHAFASNPTWVVKTGTLQRSLDNGQNWQEALRADHPLSCYLNRGAEVWAGGEAGTLFHSADGGLTWSRVQPSIGNQTLTSDISSIAATDTSAIEVSTATNEQWTTLDGGKTWARK